jgi:hypothetical protein
VAFGGPVHTELLSCLAHSFADSRTRVRREAKILPGLVCEFVLGVGVRGILHEHDLPVVASTEEAQEDMKSEPDASVPRKFPIAMVVKGACYLFTAEHFSSLCGA